VFEDKKEGLQEPGDAGDKEDGKVEESLMPEEERAPRVFLCAVRHLQGPGQDGHGVNVGITVLGVWRGLDKVGHGVMSVVLVLPPGHREALEYIADHDPREIAVCSLFENLMVQEVMGQPPALLPEEGEDEGREHLNRQGLGPADEHPGTHGQGDGGHDFPHIVQRTRLEEPARDEFPPQVSIRSLEAGLRLGLFVRAGNELANVEGIHVRCRTQRVEGCKDVSTVTPRMRKDDIPPGMILPA